MLVFDSFVSKPPNTATETRAQKDSDLQALNPKPYSKAVCIQEAPTEALPGVCGNDSLPAGVARDLGISGFNRLAA